MAGNSTLAKYTVLLEAQSARFEKAIERSERKTRRFDKRVTRSLKNVKLAFAGIATAFSVRAIAGAIGRTLEYADSISKLNDRLGISVGALSELQFAAERSGVDFRTLTLGIQRLQRRVSEAAGGFGEAKDAIAELGLDAKKLETLELDQQFAIVAEQLSKVENESDRTRLAFKLFDSEGVRLTQIMKDGAAGIEELRAEARRLGRTLTEEQAAKAVDAKDAITNLNTAFASLTDQIVTNAAPALTLAAQKLTDLVTGANTADLEVRRLEILDKIANLEAKRGRNRTAQTEADLVGLRLELELTETRLRREKEAAKLSKETAKEEVPLALKQTATVLDRIVPRIDDVRTRFRFMYNDMTMLGEDWSENAEDIFDKFAEASLDATHDATNAARELGLTFASAFEDAIVEGEKFRDVLDGILKDIIRILVRKSVTEPVAGFFSGLFTRERGGPVSAGTPYLVGEGGPEIFVPGKSGAIIPNGGGVGGVAVSYAIDARGADEAAIMQRMIPLLQQTVEITKDEVRKEMREGRMI